MWKQFWNNNKGRICAAILVLLIFSLVGNIFLLGKIGNKKQVSSEGFKLLSQSRDIAIDSNVQASEAILHYRPLREKIEERLKFLSAEEKAGFYLQDAYSGSWLGINEKEGFTPASLLKIPIAMAVLKKEERGEISLSQKIQIAPEDFDPLSGSSGKIKIGGEETIWDLLKLMIKNSDNTAKNVLKKQLSPEEINEVFTHVDIPNPYMEEDENALVAPRQFSRIFKALYYSTFLTPESSEKLLDLATETRAESLIADGMPWEIQIAHKYGERFNLLHDCGIVYHPNHPYFLCFMTSDIELTKAQTLIRDISGEIYRYIDNQ